MRRMKMPRVFVTRTVAPEAIEMLSKYAEVDAWEPIESISREEFIRRIADVDGILQWGGDSIDGTVMDAAPKLKVIANVSAGAPRSARRRPANSRRAPPSSRASSA